MVVGIIEVRRGNHLSLLFVCRDVFEKGIGRELSTLCTNGFDEITADSSDLAVCFYKKAGFAQSGDCFFKDGAWAIPMRWVFG